MECWTRANPCRTWSNRCLVTQEARLFEESQEGGKLGANAAVQRGRRWSHQPVSLTVLEDVDHAAKAGFPAEVVLVDTHGLGAQGQVAGHLFEAFSAGELHEYFQFTVGEFLMDVVESSAADGLMSKFLRQFTYDSGAPCRPLSHRY